MSSILEALNKAEEDRNARAASDSGADAPFVPETAAEALIAQPKKRRAARQSPPINWKPLIYAAGALAGAVLIVGLSAGAVLLAGKTGPAGPVVAAAVKPEAEAPVQAVGKETYTVPVPPEKESPAQPEARESKPAEKPHDIRAFPVESRPKADARPKPEAKVNPPATPPKPKPPVEAKASEPEPVAPTAVSPAREPAVDTMKVAKAEPPPAEEPTTPLPTAEAIARARAPVTNVKPPVKEPMRTSPTSLAPGRAAEKRAPLLEDINALPRLGQTERERLGLSDMRLNVLREASPSQPEGLAIINLKKVYVGEMIPGTNARLIAVQTRAIAIEIEGTGERFKVMN